MEDSECRFILEDVSEIELDEPFVEQVKDSGFSEFAEALLALSILDDVIEMKLLGLAGLFCCTYFVWSSKV